MQTMPKPSLLLASALILLSVSTPPSFAAQKKEDNGIDKVGSGSQKKEAITDMDMLPISQHPNLPADAIYTNPKADPEARAKDAV